MNLENIPQEDLEKIKESGLSVIDSEPVEDKEPIIGQFKPKRKFLNFVTGLKGRIRLLNNVAFIKGEQFSGMLEGAIFKVTICDEGTINFEETDTDLSTPDMIQRFIDEIDSKDVTGYVQKFIVSGLEFQDEDAKVCYLEVEHKKPIDMLFSIFDEEQKPSEVSETGMSILDALFSSDTEEVNLSEKDVEVILDTVENPPSPNENLKNAAKEYMEEQFRKMNEEKILELKDRIEKNERESSKLRHEIATAESKLKKQSEDLKVLETRLDSFNSTDPFNGYVFNVSDEQKEEIGLSEENREIADKIADIVGLKKEVLFKMLTQGYYKINIAEKSDLNAEKVKVTNDILQRLNSLVNSDESKDAKVTMIEPGKFEYRGSLTWHQIVDKMIRKGFEQNEEFDKVCGSNSYNSKEETSEN
jgi:hypothetical protein